MDPALIAAVVMLVLWAGGAFFLEAPGWMNLLLSLGIFLLIWRITARSASQTKHDASK